MQEFKEKELLKKQILKTCIIFVISFLISLIIWLNIKAIYGKIVTNIATHIVLIFKEVKIENISIKEKDIIKVSFVPERYKADIVIDMSIITSTYTFNVPLTFSIIASFYLFLRKKRIFLEVIIILFIIHILYVISFEGEKLTRVMIERGYEDMNNIKLFIWQFFWSFMDNMVIRFEPFLIGAYLYFRKD